VLEQIVPATSGARYRISLWAKGESNRGAMIVLDDRLDDPVVQLPEGAYPWQQVEGEFQLPAATPTDGPAPLIAIQIVSTAPGKCWLDDIRVERVSD
jgi:hypothetical protein